MMNPSPPEDTWQFFHPEEDSCSLRFLCPVSSFEIVKFSQKYTNAAGFANLAYFTLVNREH